MTPVSTFPATSSSQWTKPGRIARLAESLNLTERRNLFWSWYEPRNFGDWIGPYLFEKLTGLRPHYLSPKAMKGHYCIFAAGSILRRVAEPDTAVIWGSGIISADDEVARPAKVHAVRGPRSRARLLQLSYDCPEVYGDPGLVLPLVYQPKIKERAGVALIPHYTDYEGVRTQAAKDVRVIDVGRPVEDVVAQLACAEFTISSSLHGVIVSHAYGIPSLWIRPRKAIMGDDSKFHDYFESVGLTDVQPMQVDMTLNAAALIALRGDALCPDTTGLAQKLLAVCPFPGRPI